MELTKYPQKHFLYASLPLLRKQREADFYKFYSRKTIKKLWQYSVLIRNDCVVLSPMLSHYTDSPTEFHFKP